ncbi:TPA: hypothetical protein ACNHTG_003276, partial [Enterococcus faecalis]
KKILVFIVTCIVIAGILPVGYFLISFIFLGSSFTSALKDLGLTFSIMFVVTVIGMLIKKE